MSEKIKAEVLCKLMLYGESKALGDIVEMDSITFRNLERKGWVAAAPKPAAPKIINKKRTKVVRSPAGNAAPTPFTSGRRLRAGRPDEGGSAADG